MSHHHTELAAVLASDDITRTLTPLERRGLVWLEAFDSGVLLPHPDEYPSEAADLDAWAYAAQLADLRPAA